MRSGGVDGLKRGTPSIFNFTKEGRRNDEEICDFDVGPLLAVLFLLFPMQSWSVELPEGMTVEVIAEYPVHITGLEKV
jgi:hypothetical protein